MFYKNKYGIWKYSLSSNIEGGMMPNKQQYMANRGWVVDLRNWRSIAEYNARMFSIWETITRRRKRSRKGVIIRMPEEVQQWADVNRDYIREHYIP